MYSSKSGSGRRRRTARQRQRLLARFHESQLTQRDFARRHGVGLSTLHEWLRVENEAMIHISIKRSLTLRG
jgi:transposase-like protein